jgi:AcrR family transcriptional regulator
MAIEKLETEIRREQIAEAALALITSEGLGAVSMAAVARRVGLVPSALYRHFAGKEEILDAVIQLIRTRLFENLEQSCSLTHDPIECLKRLLHLHVKLIRENRGIPRIIFSEAVFGGNPERMRRVLEIVQSFLGAVAEIVRRGQAAGRIRADRDPETVAVLFLGIIQPAALLWHLSGGKFDVTRHAQRAWEVFRNQIEVEAPPSTPSEEVVRARGTTGSTS